MHSLEGGNLSFCFLPLLSLSHPFSFLLPDFTTLACLPTTSLPLTAVKNSPNSPGQFTGCAEVVFVYCRRRHERLEQNKEFMITFILFGGKGERDITPGRFVRKKRSEILKREKKKLDVEICAQFPAPQNNGFNQNSISHKAQLPSFPVCLSLLQPSLRQNILYQAHIRPLQSRSPIRPIIPPPTQLPIRTIPKHHAPQIPQPQLPYPTDQSTKLLTRHPSTPRGRETRRTDIDPRACHAIPRIYETRSRSIGRRDIFGPSLQRGEEALGIEVAGGVVVELYEDEVDGCLHGGERDGGVRAGALGRGG